MSERRKPLVTLHLREHADDFRVKVEVFEAQLWPEQRQFKVRVAHEKAPVPMPKAPRARHQLGVLYRLRVNGAWYPHGEGKTFVTRYFIDQFITTLLEDALYVPYARS